MRSKGSIYTLILPLVVVLFLLSVGPVLYNISPHAQHLESKHQPPLKGTLFGMDHLGRDMLARLLLGGQTTVAISLSALFFALLLGVILGLWAGYSKGLVDSILFNLMNIQLSVPTLLLAIVLAGVLGRSRSVLVFVLAVSSWVPIARITRAETMSICSKEYVRAAYSIGASTPWLVYRHILPNVSAQIIVVATMELARIILTEAALSYLGLGSPDVPSWGSMLADAQVNALVAWWPAVFPGAAIFILVQLVNRVGDQFRDMFDPKLQLP